MRPHDPQSTALGSGNDQSPVVHHAPLSAGEVGMLLPQRRWARQPRQHGHMMPAWVRLLVGYRIGYPYPTNNHGDPTRRTTPNERWGNLITTKAMAAGVDVTQPLGPPQVLEMNMNCSLEAGTGEGGRDGSTVTTKAVTPRVKRNRDGQLTERRSEEARAGQLVGDLNRLSAHGTRGGLDTPVEPSSPQQEVRWEGAGPGLDAEDPELEAAMTRSARSTSGDSPGRKPRVERRRRRPRPKHDEELRRLEAAASLAYRQGHHGFRFLKYCALYGKALEASWHWHLPTLQSLSVRSMSSAASKHFSFVSDSKYECI